jgi:hypothetical protein
MNMKNLVIIALMCFAQVITAQKYFSKTGKITFYSDAAGEKIQATNTSASTVLDASTGSIEWAVLIQGFQFEKALMKDHFNENYMESATYPKAKFKGKIDNPSAVLFSKDGIYNVNVTGQLEMHGVTKTVSVPATFTVKGGLVSAKAEFNVLLQDYNIDIPKVVEDNIATKVKLDIFAEYKVMNSDT